MDIVRIPFRRSQRENFLLAYRRPHSGVSSLKGFLRAGISSPAMITAQAIPSKEN